VRGNGMKAVDARDADFKRQMDPHGLMNPGKFDAEAECDAPAGSGVRLPATGWKYATGTHDSSATA